MKERFAAINARFDIRVKQLLQMGYQQVRLQEERLLVFRYKGRTNEQITASCVLYAEDDIWNYITNHENALVTN